MFDLVKKQEHQHKTPQGDDAGLEKETDTMGSQRKP
jgi:hypothetical protein